VERTTAGEWVGRAAREGRGMRFREPGRRSTVERRCGRSAEMVSSSDGESDSGGGLEGRAVVQIQWTVPARAVLPAPVSGGVSAARGSIYWTSDVPYPTPSSAPSSASPFEDVVGKIFDILDGRERTGHNIRLSVCYMRTASAALPFQIFYTMLFWSFWSHHVSVPICSVVWLQL
jgi:hypothetical protein